MDSIRVLLTTPDYPPTLGGLSAFTLQIEKALKLLNIEYQVFHWKSVKDIRAFTLNDKEFDFQLNVQFLGGYFLSKAKSTKQINFIHGSEILFTSPNPLKAFLKRRLRPNMISFLESSESNVFISNFSQRKLNEAGFVSKWDRDFVFHNRIDLVAHSEFKKKRMGEEIDIIMVGRDVPHKNLDGGLLFCELLSSISRKKINLYITKKFDYSSENINIIPILGIDDRERNDLYKKCHLNLMLSLDHSAKGFIEGFGLTVLEAGQFGTPSVVLPSGGMREAVHDCETGWIIPELNESAVATLWNRLNVDYANVVRKCYQHTRNHHGVEKYAKFIRCLIPHKSDS